MDILALIPARGGSKGIPRKNIKPLGGKPLIHYAIEQAQQVNEFSNIVVSTEDDEIVRVCKKIDFGIEYKRPIELAQDSTPTLPVVLHVIEEEKKRGRAYDAICLLQPTTPFRKGSLIKDVISKMYENESLDAVVSMKKVPDHFHPNWVFKQNEDGLISSYENEIVTQRQLLKPVYYRDGSVYLTKTDCLVSKQSLYGDNIAMVENTNPSVNLDTMEDWLQAENLIHDNNDY